MSSGSSLMQSSDSPPPPSGILASTVSITMRVIGLGTYQIHGTECYEAVKTALEVGYRLIDTAEVCKIIKYLYSFCVLRIKRFSDRNEEWVGKAINESGIPREEIFVTSKLHPKHLKSGKAYEACIASLNRLGLNYLDLYLIHWPGAAKVRADSDLNMGYRKETWLSMEKLVRDGKVKSIGVSNYEISHLQEMKEYGQIFPSVNQFELHPMLPRQELVEYCLSKGILVQAYSSLGQGDRRLLDHQSVIELAKKYSKTQAQILLRWATAQGYAVIPKTTRKERLVENLDCTEWNMSDEDISMLSEISEQELVRFCWDPTIVR